MRCPRCGNENPATNRFCGSCGASLLAASDTAVRSENAASTASARNSAATVTSAPASPQRKAAPASREVSGISGPSFLGLSTPPQSPGGRSPNLQRDLHHGTSSGNLDYLLDDEDEPKGGAGKVFLILIALALAIGFGYLRWRHEGLSALWAAAQKKPAAAQGVDGSQAPPNTAANGPEASPPAASGNTAPNAAQSGTTSPPAAGTTDSTSSPTGAAPRPATPASPDANAPNTTADKAMNSTATSAAAGAPPADKPATDTSGSAAASGASTEESSEPAAAPAPKPATRPGPASKPTAAKPFDQVTEAEKYIYGRGGVRQDCDRGLRMLRPAAEQSNPKAMITLGALYSTGVCAPRDLPTAYRWFALALRKQPDNQPLQENLQRLWAQMTQPERQLAVKLSQ